MTRAAAQLNVAQPALGLQIRQLEEALQVTLLERHSRGVVPTPAGKLLHERAVAILAMFEAAEYDVRAFGGAQIETVTIGVTYSTMRLAGHDMLVAAKRDLSDVRFILVEEPSIVLEKEVENGHVDLALNFAEADPSTFNQIPLQLEELVFVQLADRAPKTPVISLDTVFANELVLAGDRDPVRKMVEQAAQQANLTPNIAFEVQSLMVTRQMVLDGLATSILPYGVFADEIAQGLVRSCRVEGTPFRRTLFLTRLNRRPPFQNEDKIMRLIRATVKQLTLDLGELAQPIP